MCMTAWDLYRGGMLPPLKKKEEATGRQQLAPVEQMFYSVTDEYRATN